MPEAMSLPLLQKPIEWTPEYAIDIPLLDDQHKVLFQLMDELRLAVLEKKTRDDVSKVMKGLLDYCIAHFHAEEAVMAAVKYPTQESHAAIHRQFEEKCLGWVEDFFNGTLQPETTLKYLNQWLRNHILHNDRKLAAFIQIHSIDPATFTSKPGSSATHSSKGSHTLMRPRPPQTRRLHRRFHSHLAAALVASAVLVTCMAVLAIVMHHVALTTAGDLAVVIAALASLAIHVGFWRYARALRVRDQQHQMDNARHISDTLLAGQIATRIAAMNLDLMDDLFTNADQFSPLLASLKSIVDNLLLFRPHIPSAVFALINSHDSSEDDYVPRRDDVPGALRSPPAGALLAEHFVNDVAHAIMTPSAQQSQPHAYENEPYARPTSSQGSNNTSPTVRPSTAHWDHRGARMLLRSLRRTFVTCMAADLSGFNSFADRTPFDGLLSFHADYIRLVKAAVEANRGVIQLISGDHAFCTWNAFRPAADHSVAACHAGMEIMEGVEALGVSIKTDVKPQLGISSGKAIVGIMGCDAKSDFAIISPIVNLAFCLAKLNGRMDTTILIDSDVRVNTSSHFQAEIIAAVESPQGDATDPVFIFELKKKKVHNEIGEWMYQLQHAENEDPLREFNTAMIDFCTGRWSACVARLQRFLVRCPDHARAQAMLQQCRPYVSDPRPPAKCKFGWYDCDSFALPLSPPAPPSPLSCISAFDDAGKP